MNTVQNLSIAGSVSFFNIKFPFQRTDAPAVHVKAVA